MTSKFVLERINDLLNVSDLKVLKRGEMWTPTDPGNLHANVFLFSRIVMELYTRSCLPHVYSRINKFDVSIHDRGVPYTPDIVLFKSDSSIERIIEFKGSFHAFSLDQQEALATSVRARYSVPTDVFVLFYEHDLAVRMNFSRADTTLYTYLFNDLHRHLHLLPTQPWVTGYKHLSVTAIAARMAAKGLQATIGYVPPMPTHLMIEGILDVFPRFEEFANHHAMASNHFSEKIRVPASPTIFVSSNPWDRDRQARILVERYPTYQAYGYRAAYLHMIPPDAGVEITPDDVLELSALAGLLSPEFGNVVRASLTVGTRRTNPLLEEIHSISTQYAFSKTELTKDSIEQLAAEYHCAASATGIQTHLSRKREQVITKLRVQYPSLVLGKHGYPVFTGSDARFGIHGHYPSANGKTKVYPTVCECADWFEAFDPFREYDRRDAPISCYSGAYPAGGKLCLLSDSLFAQAATMVRHILTSKTGTTVLRIHSFYKAILAAIPRFITKGWKGNEFVLIEVPNENWLVLATPAPNEITSGTIILLYKGLQPPPASLSKCYSANLGGINYWVTAPFRLNLKVLSQPDQYLGSFLGLHALLLSYGVDALDDSLLNSLFLRPTLGLIGAFDVVYLAMKSLFQTITFGAIEIEKKLSNVDWKDIRVATIMYRLKRNLDNAGAHFQRHHDFTGIKSVLFSHTYTDIQVYLAEVYLKQIGDKHGGVDEAKLMNGFFRDEIDHEVWWNKSPFGPAFDYTQPLSIQDWSNMVLSPDNHSWTEIAYHPGVIKEMSLQVIKRAQTSDDFTSPYQFAYKEALKTASSSKVNIPSDASLYIANLSDRDHEKFSKEGKYPGLVGVNQKEAYLFESELVKLLASDSTKDFKDLINPQLHKLTELDTPLTTMELFAVESLMWKGVVTLVMVNKEQKGLGKRAFFVQTVWTVAGFRIFEGVWKAVLMTCKEDILHLPGMSKYLIIQRDCESFRKDGVCITMDQTKFGDTYAVIPFQILAQCMEETSLTTVEFARTMGFVISGLNGRVELMPWQAVQNYKDVMSGKKKPVTDAERKRYKEYTEFQTFLNDPGTKLKLQGQPFLDKVGEWPSFLKHVGFILGVLNYAGSVLGVEAAILKEAVLTKLGFGNMVAAYRHSDDGQDLCNLPEPPVGAWSEDCASRSLNLLRASVRKPTILGDTVKVFLEEEVTVDIPLWIIAKINIVLGLYITRLIGTRPSLAKWGVGRWSEMLQAIFTALGECIPPLIRWTVAIGADLPGLSYADDLTNAVSRVYDVCNNRGSDLLTGVLMVGINEMMKRRYGNPVCGVLLPPQAFGIWLCLPYHLRTAGFAANEARLSLLALENPDIRRFLELSQHSSCVWKSKAPVQTDLVAVRDAEDAGTLLTIAGRKDFCLHFNREQRTTMALQKMNRIVQNVDKKLKAAFRRDLSATGEIDRDLGIYVGLVDGSDVLNIMAIKRKYTSATFKEKFARVGKDIKVISELGYPRRQVSNPFSDVIQASTGCTKATVGIEEVWSILGRLAQDKFEIPDILHKLFDIHNTALGPAIRILSTHRLVGEIQFIPFRMNSNALQYRKLAVSTSATGFGINGTLTLVAATEQLKPGYSINNSLLFKMRPDLLHSPEFVSAASSLAQILTINGFTYDTVISNYRSLSRLVIPYDREAILACLSEVEDLESHIATQWSFDVQVVADIEYQPDSANFVKLPVFETGLLRILSLMSINCAVYSVPSPYPKDLRCKAGLGEIPIVTSDQVFDSLVKNGFTKDRANLWLTLLVTEVGANVRIFGRSKNSLLLIHPWFDVILVKNKKVFQIEAYTDEQMITTHHILTAARVLSYFQHSSQGRFIRTDQLQEVTKSAYYRFGLDLVPAITGQVGWTAVAFKREPYRLRITADWNFAMRKRNGFVYDVGTEHEWTITPWTCSLHPTGWVLYNTANNTRLVDTNSDIKYVDPTVYVGMDDGFWKTFVGEDPLFPIDTVYKVASILNTLLDLRIPTGLSQLSHNGKVVFSALVESKLGMYFSPIIFLYASQTVNAKQKVKIIYKRNQTPTRQECFPDLKNPVLDHGAFYDLAYNLMLRSQGSPLTKQVTFISTVLLKLQRLLPKFDRDWMRKVLSRLDFFYIEDLTSTIIDNIDIEEEKEMDEFFETRVVNTDVVFSSRIFIAYLKTIGDVPNLENLVLNTKLLNEEVGWHHFGVTKFAINKNLLFSLLPDAIFDKIRNSSFPTIAWF